MASKSILNEEEDEDDDADDFCCCYMPNKTVEDRAMIAALVLLITGLLIATIGYILPRNYVFDKSLPAREMEAREKHYADLSHNLDTCIIVGMSFVAVGGLLTMSVFTYTVLLECDSIRNKDDTKTLINPDNGGQVDKDYGAVAHRQ